MKKNAIPLIAYLLVSLTNLGANTLVKFTMGGAQIVSILNPDTNENEPWYQVDIYAEAPAPAPGFKLGIGQFYLNYNQAAFGQSVVANGNFYTSDDILPGTILSQNNGGNIYGAFISNDDNITRASFAWDQFRSAGAIPGNNVTAIPAWLCRVRFRYQPGQSNQPPNVCFDGGPNNQGLMFTACGPFVTAASANCTSFPGVNILEGEDEFDCLGAALPVELADFGGEWEGPNARLFWATKTEANNDFFQLERSLDGLHFEKIAEISGAGTTAEPQNYGWLDREIGQLPGEHFYYRLRQVDFDGAENLSQIVVFARDKLGGESGSGGQFSLFPNPTNGQFQLVFNGENEAMGSPTAQLFSADGRLVSQQILSKTATEFDLTDRAAGSYWLSISDENGTIQQLRVILVK